MTNEELQIWQTLMDSKDYVVSSKAADRLTAVQYSLADHDYSADNDLNQVLKRRGE